MAIKAQSPTKTLTREDRLIVDQSPLPSMLLSEPPQPSKYLRAMRNPPVLSHGLPCCILYLHDLHEMIHLSSSICYICTIKRFIFLCTINIWNDPVRESPSTSIMVKPISRTNFRAWTQANASAEKASGPNCPTPWDMLEFYPLYISWADCSLFS